MAWPTYFKPADPNLTFEASGVVEQTEVIPGSYWTTPDGKLWDVGPAGGHDSFAQHFLGGVDSAFSAGCVRVVYDEGRLGLQAKDYYAFDLNPLELIARKPGVLVFTTEDSASAHSSEFSQQAFLASYETLATYIGQTWGLVPRGAVNPPPLASVDKSKVIEEPLTVDHLTITFNDKLFDYYLAAPNMGPDWYITEIGGMKVGFGSKYQLKKFMLKLKEEFFSDGQIPGSNIKIAPIPQIEEPIVRRMGSGPAAAPTQLQFPEGFFDPEQAELLAQEMFQKPYSELSNDEVMVVLQAVQSRYSRQGSVPIIERGLPIEVKKKLEKGSVGPQVWEISEGSEDSNRVINTRPSGPML